jgi:SMI1 / KNR4 family (SUKH-1)
MTAVSDEKLFARFKPNPPATSASIARCQAELKFSLPADYVQFLLRMNGGEGFLSENAYLVLYPVEELAETNAGHVSKFAPEMFIFGSDGAGEAFAFDIRSEPRPIVAVSRITLDWCDAIVIATNFRAFLEVLFTSGIPYSCAANENCARP